MSQRLISLNADLRQLREEGYDVDVKAGHLLLKDVPYVNSQKKVCRGILITSLKLAGDQVVKPDDHVAHFCGEHPCDTNGSILVKIQNASNRRELAPGIVIDHSFSSKPQGGYDNYYDKMTTYVTIMESQAQLIQPSVTSKTSPVIIEEEDETVFNYMDNASSRSGTGAATAKLSIPKVAIVGLGGSGAYVLDLVTKTPVREIHIFDGDTFYQHNAFRYPGAPSAMELREKPMKVAYLAKIYEKMRKGIFAHPYYIDVSTVEQLREMSFVFICMDRGDEKKTIVEALEDYGIPFVDVGMGLFMTDNDSIGGNIRVTTSTPTVRDHTKNRISFHSAADNEYNSNIQIADLNALNAVLAVIKWKKIFNFYVDLENEHHSVFVIDGNVIINDEKKKSN